jgi:hypothetical protein
LSHLELAAEKAARAAEVQALKAAREAEVRALKAVSEEQLQGLKGELRSVKSAAGEQQAQGEENTQLIEDLMKAPSTSAHGGWCSDESARCDVAAEP